MPSASDSAIEPLPRGVERNAVHPALFQERELARLPPEQDFKTMITPTGATKPLPAGIEPNDENPAEHAFRTLESMPPEHDWKVTEIPLSLDRLASLTLSFASLRSQ